MNAQNASTGSGQLEVTCRRLHVPLLPSSVTSLRLRPYIRVSLNGDWARGHTSRPVRGWKGKMLSFPMPFTFAWSGPNDVVMIELWHRRRFRRDILLAMGSFPVAELLSLSQRNLALDAFVPLSGVGMKSVLGSHSLTHVAAETRHDAAPIGFAHIIASVVRPFPAIQQLPPAVAPAAPLTVFTQAPAIAHIPA